MSIYRDDRAFDLYIQAALEEECDSSDEDLNELTREIERLTAELNAAKVHLKWADDYRFEANLCRAALERTRDRYKEHAATGAVDGSTARDMFYVVCEALNVHLSQAKR